jgi:hypothetical protein
MIIGSRQKIRVIDGEMNIKINDNKINRVDFVKCTQILRATH